MTLYLSITLILDVPNLEWCCKNWLGLEEEKRWDLPLFFFFGLQTDKGQYHYTSFTPTRIKKILEERGFKNIITRNHWAYEQQMIWVEAQK